MLHLLIAVLALVIVFHIFVYHQYNYPWVAKIIEKIPGPTGIFFFGSTIHFKNLKNEDRLDEICNMFKEYGSTFKYWFSGVPTVFISELDDFQVVLGNRSNSRKGNLYKHMLPWLGRGLLTSDGKKWHDHRKLITPTFHFSILQGFVEIFNKNTAVMLKRLERQCGKAKGTDLCKYVTACTLDNVCETAMGTSVNAQSGAPNSYVECVYRLGQIVSIRLFSPLLFSDINFNISLLGWEHNNILKCLHGFTNKVIQECKLANKKFKTALAKISNDGEEVGIYKRKLTFLHMLLEKQDEYKLSNRDIREEVDTFMFEGHDTTSMGITWTLFELGCHPLVQERCYEEQLAIFGDSDRAPTYNDVMKMNYLKQVIHEALRLYPSVPVISRRFPNDIQLKDYLVPAGTEIVMCIYYLHRNPTVFPDPEKFDPDRFLPDAMTSRHSFGYVPFSAGLRNCVGQKFAMLELLIVLSSIIRKFSFESLDKREEVKKVPEMTLRPAKSLHWKITQRSQKNNQKVIGSGALQALIQEQFNVRTPNTLVQA